LDALLGAQEIDLRIQEVRQQLDRIPREQEAARDRLQALATKMAEAKSAQQENEVAIKNVELDIGTRRETVKRLKNQQFETRKNEEYQTLGQEIVRYEAQVDDLETTELELMEKADQLRSDFAEAEKAHATIKHGVDEEVATLTKRAAEFETELVELQEKRAQALAAVDPDLVALYERLLKSRGAPVVVAVTPERSCTGCHVMITPSTMVRVQAQKETVSCENCGRILYPA
jgi:predicted  nucleic acid-binding Zn-ribbon protein